MIYNIITCQRHSNTPSPLEHTRMLKRRQIRKQRRGINDALTQIRWKDEDVGLPQRIVEAQGRDQAVPHRHEEGSGPDKRDEFPVARHDVAGNDASDGGREGGDGESCSGFGGGVEEDDLEKEWEHEEVL